MDGEIEGARIDLVTVDGGASGCRLAAFDERDRRVAEIAIDAHASLTLGEAEAWTTIRAGIARLAGALANRPADAVPGFGADTAIAADPGTDASGEDVVPARPDTVSTWLPATLGLGLAGALQGRAPGAVPRARRARDGRYRPLPPRHRRSRPARRRESRAPGRLPRGGYRQRRALGRSARLPRHGRWLGLSGRGRRVGRVARCAAPRALPLAPRTAARPPLP